MILFSKVPFLDLIIAYLQFISRYSIIVSKNLLYIVFDYMRYKNTFSGFGGRAAVKAESNSDQ